MNTGKYIVILLSAFFLSSQAFAGDHVGIVMLHGKAGKKANVSTFASTMRKAGALVETPTMPYPRYSGPVSDALARIDTAVRKLKRRGANIIIVGGISMGANTALAYAARRKGVTAILAIAPGHVPDSKTFQQKVRSDFKKAKAMIDAGNGQSISKFRDNNQGRAFSIRTKASIYYSWFNPEGDAVIPRNAARLKAGTALLWMVGTKDRMYRRGKGYAYSLAPSNPRNRYLTVSAGHKDTIVVGGLKICSWVANLLEAKGSSADLNCASAFRGYSRQRAKRGKKKLCRQGDINACRRACARGKEIACERLDEMER